MIDTRCCLAVIVAYRSWPWTAVAVGSFQEWFPDLPLLIVDNNPADADLATRLNIQHELRWLRTRSNLEIVANPGPDRWHGTGIDLALRHCRGHQIEFLVHIEPDCLISGRQWLENLWVPIERGAWMSGMHRKSYGPIHPTPSLWRVDVEWGTFNHRPRGEDARHVRFGEVFRLRDLLKSVQLHEPQHIGFWETHWDTAQRNWFLAAVHGRAELVDPTPDFHHFWIGSQQGPDPQDPRLARYLNE